MATRHKVTFDGEGTARVLLDDRPPITFLGSGERNATLSGADHEITYAIAGQAGRTWRLAVFPSGQEDPVWQRKGKIPRGGLEVGGDEFGGLT